VNYLAHISNLERSGVRTSSQEKIEVLQAMRAIAALAVLCVHLPTLGWGNWGVDLFFVISGFIICYTTESSPRGFIRKRIIRVVPIYWLFTFGLFAVTIVAPSLLDNTTPNITHLLKSLFFIPFDKNGSGNFPILFLGWTLNYEMFFYAIFAIALAISHRLRIGLSAILIFGVNSLTINLASELPLGAYSEPIVYEFSMGMLVYLLATRPDSWAINALLVMATLAFGLFASYDVATDNRVFYAGIPSAIFLLITLSALGYLKIPTLILILGDASYCLYLSHPYIIEAIAKLGLFNQGTFLALFTSVATLLLCAAFSIWIWLNIEQPIGRILRRKLL
jgi:exopolysaccharide production protein ExoZ